MLQHLLFFSSSWSLVPHRSSPTHARGQVARSIETSPAFPLRTQGRLPGTTTITASPVHHGQGMTGVSTKPGERESTSIRSDSMRYLPC